MDTREVIAAARRIKRDAAAIAASDRLLVGQALQIRRLAEWIEELASISLGNVTDPRAPAEVSE